MIPLLHCRTLGEGDRVVVLLHGLLGQSNNLDSIARAFARDRQVLLPDLRNHGRSFHDAHMDYPAMADDIARLLDARSVDAVVMLGHSMGGKVAMQFACDHPARCGKLVVADIAPVAYAGQHEPILAALAAIDDPGMDRAAARAALERRIADPAVVSLLLMGRARDDDGNWFWRFNVPALAANYARLLLAPGCDVPCDVPTLFVSGGRSTYMSDDGADAARRLFPRSRFVSIPDAGHWLHADQPAAFLQAVLPFCDDVAH